MTSYAAYIALLGISVTPFHGEAFDLGSSLVLLKCQTFSKCDAKAVKVWICIKDAERCRRELDIVLGRRKFGVTRCEKMNRLRLIGL